MTDTSISHYRGLEKIGGGGMGVCTKPRTSSLAATIADSPSARLMDLSGGGPDLFASGESRAIRKRTPANCREG